MGVYSNDQFTSENKAYADGQNLVSVYYDGQKKTVATNANTVGEALQKMGVTLGKGDVVEPAADQPLAQAVTNINIYRAYPYLILDGNKKTHAVSGYRSPRMVIEQAGVKLYPEDIISSERVNEFLQDNSVGERLTINRATPVSVVLAGKAFEFRTHKKTVRELFVEKGLEIKPADIVKTSLDEPLYAGMKIVVSRLAQRIVTVEAGVAQSTQYVTDPAKPVGSSEVKDQGAPGKKIQNFAVTEQDGVEQARELLEEHITVQPRAKVIIIGPVQPRNTGGPTPENWAKLRFCESGNFYQNKKNPVYRGAYQFDYATWNNYGGFHDPADAPPAVQDAKAFDTYRRRGAQPWPLCGRFIR